ncbi:hypothetical protein J1D01_00025 [Seonamhaeicola sp. NFXS20]|uniref:hypothetical protein n=1 Tax=Seonamhaeicola sp. NFXS20 TaxID=2816959 RepID=UPI003B8D8710
MNETDSILSNLNIKNQILSDSGLIKIDSLLLHLSKNQDEILSVIHKSDENRIIEFMTNDLFWALVGGFIGVILSIMIWLGKRTIESCIYKKRYGKYDGYYVSKIASDTNDPHYVIKLEQKRNEFKLKGVSIKIKNGELEKRYENITGHITMSNASKIFGIGQYQHVLDKKNKIRSGEYHIQLTPERKIIVIQDIIDNNLQQSNPKYIWEPICKKKHLEYFDIYNSLIK